MVCSAIAVKLMGNMGNTVVSMGRTEDRIGITVKEVLAGVVEEALVGVIGEVFVRMLEETGARKVAESLV